MECSLGRIAKDIADGKFSNIVLMVGAGISVSCGIPDFRTPGTGLYDNLQKYNLPTPQHVFDLNYFRQTKGKAFYELSREIWPSNFKPSITHQFIKLLEVQELLLRCYTQNIDTLERAAGVSDEKLIEAHGSYSSASCISCDESYSIHLFESKIRAREVPVLCETCGGLVKPNIVFFGESLPEKFSLCLKKDFKKCDLLLIMGTSLTVQPFASLIDLVNDDVPRLLLNREAVGIRTPFTERKGLRLFQNDNKRDIFAKGNVDDNVRLICDLISKKWRTDLEFQFIPDFQLKESSQTKQKAEETFIFCHNHKCSDWPDLEDISISTLESKLKNLKISNEKNKNCVLYFEKEKQSFVLTLTEEVMKIQDEDDYIAVVPLNTTELIQDSYLDYSAIYKTSTTSRENEFVFRISLPEEKPVELWYISNETGRVKCRFILHPQ